MAPTLLDCWACRDLQRFRAVLKGTQQQGAAGPSPRSPPHRSFSAGGPAHGGPCPPAEVNRRDHLGRTVLHLIASSTEGASVDWLTAILAHPSTNVNLGDGENGWTPLHRALYHGNLLTAQLLLRRATGSGPADYRLKDLEGLTPFDLYNATVAGSAPSHPDTLLPSALQVPTLAAGELYAWGANRNYSLGFGDGADRALPDRCRIETVEVEGVLQPAGQRYDRVGVRDVAMSKFATFVLTDESSSNVRCAGISGHGRIGRAPQTQTKLEPLRDFHETACAIAVGLDHTCIVTTSGALFTFGHNKFQQLGYVLEHGQGVVASSSAAKGSGGAASATFGAPASQGPASADLDVQISPRRVAGVLKREHVLGAAAGKLHSAAFTSEALFTWGTNAGQLGYDRAASPVQITPRKVSAVTAAQAIRQVAVTDFATACLLASGDVLVLHNDTHFIIRFPQPGFSSDMSVFRPRQARPKPLIKKLVAGSSNVMAAVSDMGDVFTFSLGHPSEYASSAAGGSGGATSAASAARQTGVKPQLIWSVRKNKKVGAAEDVALGAGSDLILVTESGHVFVRSRPGENGNPSGGGQGAGKGKAGWKAIPLLQRVVKVAANESGGFAAIKTDAELPDIKARGRSLEDDLLDLLQHLKAASHAGATSADEQRSITAEVAEFRAEPDADSDSDSESEAGESSAERYVRMAQLIGEAVRRFQPEGGAPRFSKESVLSPPFGVDLFIVATGRYLPAHRVIVAARVPALAKVLQQTGKAPAPPGIAVKHGNGVTTLELPRCSFPTACFLLHYLYTDDLPAVWLSIGYRVEAQYKASKIDRTQVRSQLQGLAELLDLSALASSLVSPVPRPPDQTLRSNMRTLFASAVAVEPSLSPLHDVKLRFADRDVPAHSAILRRSPFFAALLQPDWTFARWEQGIITVDMSHIPWRVARIVLEHLYTDAGAELFLGTDAGCKLDAWLDFVTEVLAAANELLLDKLKLVCSSLLRKRVLPTNVAALLSHAEFLHALPLKEATMDYISRTMETLLEGGMLDELELKLVRDLTHLVRRKQDERMHRTQNADYLAALVLKHQEYYESLDIPPPSLNLVSQRVGRRPPRSPSWRPIDASTPARRTRSSMSPAMSPEVRATGLPGAAQNDAGLFSMDEDEAASPELAAALAASRAMMQQPTSLSLGPSRVSTPGSTPWRSRTVEADKSVLSVSPKASPAARPPGVDLRSIMASEQARRPSSGLVPTSNGSLPTSAGPSGTATPVKQPPGGDAMPLSLTAKLSQRDRKKQQQQQLALQQQQQPSSGVSGASPQAGTPKTWSPTLSPFNDRKTSGTAASPWAAIGKATTPGSQPVPAMDLDSSSPLPSAAASSSRARAPQVARTTSDTAPAAAGLPALGPTITPQRGVRPPARRNGSEVAWAASTPSFTPPAITTPAGPSYLSSSPSPSPAARGQRGSVSQQPATSPPTGGAPGSAPRSFAAIQAEEQQRLERLAAAQASAKKQSFAQLVEEERRAAARREEAAREKEAFEAWFEEEARRLRIEEGGGAPAPGNAPKRGGKGKGKGNKDQQPQQQQSQQPPRGPKRGGKAKAGGAAGAAGVAVAAPPDGPSEAPAAPRGEGAPRGSKGRGGANRGGGGKAAGRSATPSAPSAPNEAGPAAGKAPAPPPAGRTNLDPSAPVFAPPSASPTPPTRS